MTYNEVLAAGKVLEVTGDGTKAEQVALSGDSATRIIELLGEILVVLHSLHLIASVATSDEVGLIEDQPTTG